VHDFNPGEDNGLFWTIPIPSDAVDHHGKGSASLEVDDLDVEDYHDVVNALTGGPSVTASVSFDCHWGRSDDRVKINNAATGFAGTFVRNTATLTWSGKTDVFAFTADVLNSGFATTGHERNGVFFTHNADNDNNTDENDGDADD
jgi:hypothetical protein